MLENSQDILNIVKSVSLGIVAALISWFIYYLARIMQQMFKLVREFREKLKKIDLLLSKCSAKLGAGVSGFLYITEGVKMLMDNINNKKKTKKKTKKKK